MLFINNNHFELLIKKDYNKNLLISDIIKKTDLKDLLKTTNNSI